MGLSPQARQSARGVDGTDVRADGLEGRESAPLGFDFAEDIFADGGAEVGGGAVEPAAFFEEQVGGHALGFVEEVVFLGLGLVELADGFVDLVAADGGGGFEAVGGAEFAAGGLLRLQEIAQQDVAVCEGFFDDEGVGGVVVEGVRERGGFGGALGGVVVACCLDDAAELAVGG